MIVINKRLLNVNEAADYLSISRSKLYQLTDKGKIQSIKIDGSRRFDVCDLDLFVENQKSQN